MALKYSLALVIASLFTLPPLNGDALAEPSSPESIWFSPRQDSVDMTQPPGERVSFTKYDFPTMLPADAPWQTAASRVSVLTIGLHTLERFGDLRAVVAMTNRYHVKVATAGAMIFTDGLCARGGVEGMDVGKGFAREIVGAITRWKASGGRLDYVIMDAPLYFGYYASAKDCHYSIADIAHRAAITFKEVQKIYPDIRVMDAEGPGATPVNLWLPDLGAWLGAFKAESGHAIDAVGMDFHWTDTWHTGYNWMNAVQVTSDFLHRRGVAAGLYINADDRGVANAQWMDANREHMRSVATSKAKVDFLYIASWTKYPIRNLPENDPSAYTSLVDDAFAYLHAK